MKKIPKVLVIAGSDSGAGAGIQADIKSISANGAYATTAITSITAQNTVGVQAISDVPLDIIKSQISSILQDIGADVIKTGMLSNSSIVELISDTILANSNIPLVLDPVMLAKGGEKLLSQNAIEALKQLLIPKAFLITPNIPEAEELSGLKISSAEQMPSASIAILERYNCHAILLKGGHLDSDELIDTLVYKPGSLPQAQNHLDSSLQKGYKILKLSARRINTQNTHGTGCTYASAIAANLAKGQPLENAVSNAHKYLQQAITQSYIIGQGHNPVNHFWNLKG